MKRFTMLGRLAAATLAVVALASPLAAQGGQPWIQTAVGEIVGVGEDGALLVAFSGQDNRLGRYTAVGKIKLAPTDPTGLSYTSSGVMTAASGDQLFYEGEGTLHPIGTNSHLPLPFTETLTVTGGTGRFRHAGGWAYVNGIGRGITFHTIHKGELSY